MSKSAALRLSGLAAMAGGILMIPAGIAWAYPAWSWVSVIGWILLTFGLMGTYSYQVDESGLPAFLGFIAMVAGIPFMVGQGRLAGLDYYALGATLSAVGIILLAIGTLRGGRFPRWTAWVWFATIAVGVPAMFLAGPLAMAIGLLASAGLGLGFVGTGCTLWTRLR